MSEPDLFVVCKSCGSEVSPYVTECPYCGQRVRKRAPPIGRDGSPEPAPKRTLAGRLPRLRREEIPGIAPETPPYAVMTLIAISLLATLVLSAGEPFPLVEGGVYAPIEGEWWRLLASPLVHVDAAGYQFMALLGTGVFGTLLERRFGRVAVLCVFLLAGAAGAALASVAGMLPALGANGAALGLLCAWLVDDRIAVRRGEPRESDSLAVIVAAVVLVLLAAAEPQASLAAAVGGALTGGLLGLALTAVRPGP